MYVCFWFFQYCKSVYYNLRKFFSLIDNLLESYCEYSLSS